MNFEFGNAKFKKKQSLKEYFQGWVLYPRPVLFPSRLSPPGQARTCVKEWKKALFVIILQNIKNYEKLKVPKADIEHVPLHSKALSSAF